MGVNCKFYLTISGGGSQEIKGFLGKIYPHAKVVNAIPSSE